MTVISWPSVVQPLLHLLSDDTTVLRLTKVVVTILMMDESYYLL